LAGRNRLINPLAEQIEWLGRASRNMRRPSRHVSEE